MKELHSTVVAVKCPHCGNKFNPEEAIEHDIRVQLEKEFDYKVAAQSKIIENQIKEQEAAKYAARLKALEEDRKTKELRLRELEDGAFVLEQREQQIKEREESVEIEMKKRLMVREKLIYEQAEKRMLDKVSVDFQEREQKFIRERESLEVLMKKRTREESEKVREEERLKIGELQKKLDDQSKLINEMKRKSEQGSMQLQGEVQELAIEEYLTQAFMRDDIEEISKGKRGGDCVHVVKDQYDRVCGRILYESKRTRHFSHDWISKIKEDMRFQQAALGVIVTEVFPDGMTRFGEVDGIWVCSFVEFKALALLFRYNLIRIGEIVSSQENRGEKMQMIYSYVTGNEFKQKLEAAFESYREMQDDLTKEKTLLTSQWAKREKKLFKAMENLVCLYGDVRGIAGGAVQQIQSLEMSEINLLQ